MTDDVLQEVFEETEWYVDGHQVSATGELHARAEVKAMYNLDAVEVRPWVQGVDVETGDTSNVMYVLDYKLRGEHLPFENVEAMYFSFGLFGKKRIGDYLKEYYEHYGCITGDESHPCIGSHDEPLKSFRPWKD